MDIETIELFRNSQLESTDQLRHWQNTDVNKGGSFSSSNQLARFQK